VQIADAENVPPAPLHPGASKDREPEVLGVEGAGVVAGRTITGCS
jgi:hypothetical protein